MATAATLIQRGVLASRPTATTYRAGILYQTTDETPNTVYRCNGTTWDVYVQDGAAGADGADGSGVPTGGTTGQALVKQSGTDGDTVWGDTYRPSGTDVAVADGGTGASSASAARTNLGLVIGTNVQAWDADLDTYATKTPPSGAVVGTTDTQTLTNKTLTSPAIATPTGLVKGDVGLGNVDNTSNATERAATATLTNKTLTTPTIGDMTNATHSHTNAAGGGTLGAAAIGSGTVATARLGSGTADATTYLRGDQTWATVSGGGGTGDASTNTSSSVDGEGVLFSGTGGKTLKRSTLTGIVKATSGVHSAATAGTDYYNPGGTDVAVADGGTGASSASAARTNLGLVIGTDVVAPNQDTTGKAAKTDALNSATTVVNVSSATAPSSGQVLTATGSTAATWQTPSAGTVGYMPFASVLGIPAIAVTTAGTSMVANGGAALVPIEVTAPLLVTSVTIRSSDTATARSWEWRLYREPSGGGATLDEIAGLNGSESFTPTIASNRTAAATTPATIQPGIYWLAVRNTHATSAFGYNSFTIGASSAGYGGNGGQTKTLGSALGSTLDATTSWTKATSPLVARVNGGVFGQVTTF